MTNIQTTDEIFLELNYCRRILAKTILIVLIGGCSRAGKSSLARELFEKSKESGIDCCILNIDSWLVSVDKRKPFSKVTERFDMTAVNRAVEEILNGKIVTPPVYDPITRRQIQKIGNDPISITSGILIIDGVITLANEDLMKKSDYRIFVKISECVRLRRLIDFYSRIKKVPRKEYKKIIRDREKEEVPLIKKSSSLADVIFEW